MPPSVPSHRPTSWRRGPPGPLHHHASPPRILRLPGCMLAGATAPGPGPRACLSSGDPVGLGWGGHGSPLVRRSGEQGMALSVGGGDRERGTGDGTGWGVEVGTGTGAGPCATLLLSAVRKQAPSLCSVQAASPQRPASPFLHVEEVTALPLPMRDSGSESGGGMRGGQVASEQERREAASGVQSTAAQSLLPVAAFAGG